MANDKFHATEVVEGLDTFPVPATAPAEAMVAAPAPINFAPSSVTNYWVSVRVTRETIMRRLLDLTGEVLVECISQSRQAADTVGQLKAKFLRIRSGQNCNTRSTVPLLLLHRNLQ